MTTALTYPPEVVIESKVELADSYLDAFYGTNDPRTTRICTDDWVEAGLYAIEIVFELIDHL